MRQTADQFLQSPHKSISLVGMSGVGKTTLCNLLSRDNWYHYSGDYRIGTRYVSEAIIDNVKSHAMQVPLLRDLLRSDSISITNNLSFHNLDALTTYLGKLGDTKKGGMSLEQFKKRQAIHCEAEIKAMLDVPKFKEKAQTIYQYPHFVNDIGGSICEVATPEVMEVLAKNSLILYLKTDAKTEKSIVERAIAHPKPMYFHPDFLDAQYAVYKQSNTEIDPDEFARWIFPRLMEHRLPSYQNIADKYGYTLDAGQIAGIKNEPQLLDWIASALD